MKTITMVVCNRPEYTEEVIESLRLIHPRDYTLFIRAEPVCEETIDICRAVDFMSRDLIVNEQILGVNFNNKAIFDHVFSVGSSFNIAIEDDTPLCADALELAEWFWRNPNREEYLTLNLFSDSKNSDAPLEVIETNSFCPWGFCMTKDAYAKYIEPNWMTDARGWDWSICTVMQRLSLKSLAPRLSRSRNIGRKGGVHCTAERYDRRFGNHVASSGIYGNGFHVQISN